MGVEARPATRLIQGPGFRGFEVSRCKVLEEIQVAAVFRSLESEACNSESWILNSELCLPRRGNAAEASLYDAAAEEE